MKAPFLLSIVLLFPFSIFADEIRIPDSLIHNQHGEWQACIDKQCQLIDESAWVNLGELTSDNEVGAYQFEKVQFGGIFKVTYIHEGGNPILLDSKNASFEATIKNNPNYKKIKYLHIPVGLSCDKSARDCSLYRN